MSHIIKLMNMLEYNVDQGGVCYGIVHSAIRAQLQSQESLREWLQIHRFIVECPDLGALAKSVQEVRSKRKKGSYRDSQKKVEQIIEKIPAFLDTIQLYQSSGYIDPLRAENTMEKNRASKNIPEGVWSQNYAKLDGLFEEHKETFGEMLQVSCGLSFAAWLEARGGDCDSHVAFEIMTERGDHSLGLCCLTDDNNNSQWIFINHDYVTIVPRKKGLPGISPSPRDRLDTRSPHFYDRKDIELIQRAIHPNSFDPHTAVTGTQVLFIQGLSDRPQKKSVFANPLVFLFYDQLRDKGNVLIILIRLIVSRIDILMARERFILVQAIVEMLPHKNKLSYLLHDSGPYSLLHISGFLGLNDMIRPQLQGLSHEEKALYLSYVSTPEQTNALHVAAYWNQAVCLETMLQSVDGEVKERILSAQDVRGFTPLHCAVANKALESIATLTKYMSPSCQALRNHAGKTAADMTTDPQIIQLLSNHHDFSVSESLQALPKKNRLSSSDTMDKLKAMHDSLEDLSKDRALPHTHGNPPPEVDCDDHNKAKGSSI